MVAVGLLLQSTVGIVVEFLRCCIPIWFFDVYIMNDFSKVNSSYPPGHPGYLKPILSDFTPFHIGIGICVTLLVILLLTNFVLCCFSKHKEYIRSHKSGNRWILPLFITTPKNSEPLDI